MPTSYGQRTASNISDLSLVIGIGLLILYLYTYCYPLFEGWGLTSRTTDYLLAAIIRTGLFDNPIYGKIYSVIFILLGILASPNRIEPGSPWESNFIGLLIGLGIYFWMPFFGNGGYRGRHHYVAYIMITTLNMIWIMRSAGRVARYMPHPWADNDPFGYRVSGFPQLNRRLDACFSLQLRSRYLYKGRQHSGWINLVNPRRGVLIIGSPGSGKSWFIIGPLIRQLAEKGMAMLVYDFKYDALTKLAYAHFQANRKRYPADAGFYSINFTDPARSHRCNVLAPDTMKWLSDALGVARTILLSINKTWIDRQGDFFVESPIIFLAALIWFLRRYRDGIYCTLPHVIELAKLPYDKLFLVLGKEPSIDGLIDPFLQAYTNGTTEMLDGQIAGAKIPLARLSSPDIYYILTGNDFNLNINNPIAPAILCLGGDPARTEALSPVLSLYIDRLNRICNEPDRHPCAIVCDEFATVRTPAVLTTLATGRSHNIIPILAVQDMAQLRTLYSRDEADWILGVRGNVLCGQVSGETARSISQRFPRIQHERQSISVNSVDTSVSRHLEWEDTVTPATVSGLSSGEFVGVVADDPLTGMTLKAFQAKIIREKKDDLPDITLPIVRPVTDKELMEAYNQVQLDIAGMVADIMSGIIDYL